ncbi:unnamed protein product [Ceratitis capitata]|uniref:(Mediterranean fruit fly) hypothetical protein n=1 Tax=Ceratitis capitata TaxID=7213 RepID=A0A811UYB0_CERCA|nr:unnamed protein product [Ceratitis capitata]
MHFQLPATTISLLLFTVTLTTLLLLPTPTLARHDVHDDPADVTADTAEPDSYGNSNSNKYVSKCDKNPLSALTFQLSGNNLRWPCESTKNIYVQSGRYVPRNVIVTRAQLRRDDAFVALPRYKQGVPFTLGRVQLKKGQCIAKIAPYPCWAIQEEGNCQALQSVVDIAVDPNGLLWALDVGLVNTLEQPIRRCGPKIVAINTADNKVVKSIDLKDLVTAESRLQFIVVDYSRDKKPFVYVADAGARSILVYDIAYSKSYRIVLPKATAPTTDVLYMALTSAPDGTSTLFFTYLSSPRLYSIRGQYLRVGQGAGSIVDVGAKPYGKQMVYLAQMVARIYSSVIRAKMIFICGIRRLALRRRICKMYNMAAIVACPHRCCQVTSVSCGLWRAISMISYRSVRAVMVHRSCCIRWHVSAMIERIRLREKKIQRIMKFFNAFLSY